MSSTNKTEYLKLNSWVGTDIPCREDFVRDNVLVDNKLKEHCKDTSSHLTTDEREKWNNLIALQSYSGDGGPSQAIKLNCPFTPRWGFVYARDYPTSRVDFNNKTTYHFFGCFSTGVTTTGLELRGDMLIAKTSPCHYWQTDMYSFNNHGVDYEIVMFR